MSRIVIFLDYHMAAYISLKKIAKRVLKIFLYLFIFIVICLVAFLQMIKISPPEIKDKRSINLVRKNISKDFYTINQNWIKKNDFGLYEMYIEGDPFERGVINGKLTKELAQKQEDFFVQSIREIVPSETYLKFLRYFIGFFNRNIDEYIPKEYLKEIYGESFSASKDYEYIGTPYERLLNYHAAHDIGHALQGMNMVVGCTSFSVWGEKCYDSTMLIGRNFDFYVGDSFAKNKIIEFVHPTTGHDFMMVTWAGMIGCVSGMNDQGMTLTINASKSDYPTAAKTPISILSREILQYAKNIDQAYVIAKSRKTFVSESIMIGSWLDQQTAIIEKSPSKCALLRSTGQQIICSNHYQSDSFRKDVSNKENIENSTSAYRYHTVENELKNFSKLNMTDVAKILRKRNGINNEDLGMGNEKALNQLICHHSVIFKPNELKMWVSAGPYQIGTYVCYDMKTIFSRFKGLSKDTIIYNLQDNIGADSFLYTKEYHDFENYKTLKHQLLTAMHKGNAHLGSSIFAKNYISLNPSYYDMYYLLGRYYAHFGKKKEAIAMYQLALSKNVSCLAEIQSIQKRITELKKP